jgi:hypothetical protein
MYFILYKLNDSCKHIVVYSLSLAKNAKFHKYQIISNNIDHRTYKLI